MNDMTQLKVLIFIVAYNAEKHIEAVLGRIPSSFMEDSRIAAEILVIDDASKDNTVEKAQAYAREHNLPMRVFCNPVNQGYGGNQKIGYTYAVEHGFDVVVLLHGDGQYPPEMLGQMVAPITNGEADAVFGSRMMVKRDALKGGMPVYKFIGNIVLTRLQNFVLGTRLTEFHSGYRAYRVMTLAAMPFAYNSDDFDFDTDIIIQLVDKQAHIREIAIPTHYGEEVCNVNGVKYALQILHSTFLSRVQKFGIYYTRRFDYTLGQLHYESKVHFPSTQTFAMEQITPGSVVLDIGCGEGYAGCRLIEEKQCIVYGMDKDIGPNALSAYAGVQRIDLNSDALKLPEGISKIDYVLLLDVIERLDCPERFLADLRELVAPYRPKIIATSGNIGFCIVRFSLLIGQFNYGKRGILGMTNRRLFTFRSFRRLLQEEGMVIEMVKGIPVPIPFVVGNKLLARALMSINRALIALSKGLFAYQIAVVAQVRPTLGILLKDARKQSGKDALS